MRDKHAAITGDPLRPRTPSGHSWCWHGPLDPARTYGAAADRFYKTVASEAAGPRHRQGARGEFALLRRCRGLAGVPEALELIDDAQHQVLVLQRVPDGR